MVVFGEIKLTSVVPTATRIVALERWPGTDARPTGQGPARTMRLMVYIRTPPFQNFVRAMPVPALLPRLI